MVGQVVAAVLAALGAALAGVALVAVVCRWHARRFNGVVANDLLRDWEQQLELLHPSERRRAELTPPANVVAAMVALPSGGRAGLRGGDWTAGPADSFDRH
jgi:hypothetical protein